MEGENHIIHQQDRSFSKENRSHSSRQCHAPVKQDFTLYTKSRGVGSPTAAASVAVRKQKNRSESSSPLHNNSVYLAIPKPVYGRNPCCDELGCMRGRYSVEHGFPPIPNTVYKHNWLQADAHYSERPAIRKKADPAPHHGSLHFDPSAEWLKRVPVEAYSPGTARTLPAVIDPNYANYPCTLTPSLFGSLNEQSQQTSPRFYPGSYPSHHTYEHMTSEVYQEHSPMTKYGHPTQHPMFYYTQADVEVENRTQCKDTGSKLREDVPAILKHTFSAPREHYMMPQLLHGEIPMPFPSAEFPNLALMQGFPYPCYAVPRFNLNTGQSRLPPKRQHASHSLHSNHLRVSPSTQYMEYPTSLHRDKPSPRLHVEPSHANSPFFHVDQTSPTRCSSRSAVSPFSTQTNRLFPTDDSLDIDQPGLPTAELNMDRFHDYSLCDSQFRCLKVPKGLPVSPGVQLPPSPHRSSDQVVHNNSKVTERKIIHPPAVILGSKHNGPTSSSGSEGRLKRSISHVSSPIEIKEERDLYEVEQPRKQQKVNTENPPMPVINSVFSLAPYQAHLRAPRVILQGKVPQRPAQSPNINENEKGQDENKPVVCQSPKEICANSPTEEPVVEICEPKILKVENDAPATNNFLKTTVSQRDRIIITNTKEPEETGASNSGHVLVIKKCDPDERESKPLIADKKEASDESKPGEVTPQTNSSPKSDTCSQNDQAVTLQPKSNTPPEPRECRMRFKNIPPHCLKLSTCNIILLDPKACTTPDKPPEHLTTEGFPKLDLQMPVRKHFFELHQSLYKLISKSVLASSEQQLRTWLSQLELSNMYTAQERCPFPHVMRTGAVFLPMLVVKELLFPMVQGSYIDQVLQEHKVELRPTTLSEEKILIQLHKRACSSKLRKLMSLKHLPDIYADVVSLLYYTCVSEHLGEFRSTKCSGVILKLRRMFSERLHRKKSCYQAVLDSRAFANPSLLQTTKGEGEVSGGMDVHRRAASFPPTLRSLRSASKRKRRSLLKIKYCPYLSACHSAEHRRRWVLRSAVQRAQRAMRLYNPDLVGKRIRHLYEEDDKSEVWYRGEVLRVHEAHVNPLKTVFEVRYDSEPEWKYYLELLMDYKKGWLKIED
uniref:Uncharacterized protein n=1 Tax=Mola mola TaxID=94237 RepID=A0A3Q4AHK2_MOLML